MGKKLTLVFVIIILLIVAGAFGLNYLNTYYLPQIIKAKVIKEASDKLGITVQIKDIKLNLFKGIVFYDINIVNKRDLTSVLQIKRISSSFLIVALLKQRKIILPSINIESPVLNIIRYEDGKFNIGELIPKQTSSVPLPVLIYKLNIYGSKINFLDKTTQPNFNQILKLENIKAQIAPSGINFSLEGTLINEKQSSTVELSGKFQFKTKELKMLSYIDKLNILPYIVYLKTIAVSIESLFINNLFTECTLMGDTLSIKPNFDVVGANLVKDETSLSNINAKLITHFTFDLKDFSNFNYLINIDKLNANLTNKHIPELIKIDYAKLEISANKLDIENAIIKALQTSINLKGNLENFSDPAFNIDLQTNIDLAIAKDFLKNYFGFVDSITVEGKSDVKMQISKLKDKKDLEFNGSLNLQNALVKTKDSPYEISDINGLINFNQEKINWSDLSLGFLDEMFNSNATISNFKSPEVALELKNDKMHISAKINSKQKNTFDVEYLKGNYYNSVFQIYGNLDIQNKNNYYVDLDIQSQIELNDLKRIKNLPQEIISKINPQGKFDVNGKIQGNIKNPTLLNSRLNISSNELMLYGLRLGYPQIQLIQENQQIKIPQANCSFYGGTISLNGLIDLVLENFPYALKIMADNIILYKLKDDTPMKDKDFEGYLSGNVILSGPAASLLDSKGQGNFLIKDGYLWEFNPLKKLGDFLFIPRHNTLVFKEAKADFSIGDRKASTENLTLNSDIISLSCKGNIDFSGNLDFEVAPYPISQDAETTNEFQGIFSGEMAKLAGISIVQVKGTIQDPKIEIKVVAKEIFDKVKEGFKGTFDKIKDITDLIFGGEE